MAKMIIKKDTWYFGGQENPVYFLGGYEDEDEEDIFIRKGSYECIEDGVNGYPMIKVNGEWLDWAADEDDESWKIIK